MNYLEMLSESAKKRQSIVCFGLDPVLDKMPSSLLQPRGEKIVYFFSEIIDAALNESQSISAIKPNYAFFAQYGFDGLNALKALIDKYKGKLPIILDAKRGDIGKSSAAYAAEAFSFWGADAVTVSPYMGYDSVSPFLEHCKAGKGVYILCRTSNTGAKDFQSLVLDNSKQLFLEVARKITKWHSPGIGAVLGATSQEELEAALWVFYDSKKPFCFLIPGVGTQGGSVAGTVKVLRTVWSDSMPYHRINASSSIAYACKKEGTDDYVGAALKEIKKLNKEIQKI